MAPESLVATLAALSKATDGAFRGSAAISRGLTRKQLAALRASGVIARLFPDTYLLSALPPTDDQSLRAALLWGGEGSAACENSAGQVYRLDGVSTARPKIVVARKPSLRHASIDTFTTRDRASLMVRTHRGFPGTGPEATLVAMAARLDDEAFEIACEDARRRRLTTVPALRAYVDRFGRSGRPGIGALRDLLDDLDPAHPSRSTLEVKTRRLLVAHGLVDFVREFPLAWSGRTYSFDFAFVRRRTILETNGRRWHDDATDYEHDQEKWSVPGRHGFKLVFATWDKVTRRPDALVAEIAATLAA